MKKLSQNEFMRIFFLIGAITFFGVGISSIFTNAITWKSMLLSMKFSAVLNNIFSFVVAAVFYHSFKGSLVKPAPELSEAQAEEAIKNLKIERVRKKEVQVPTTQEDIEVGKEIIKETEKRSKK